MNARCQCGQLTIDLPDMLPTVVACHCLACQRRTGAPLGVLAYYPEAALAIVGEARRYTRPADSGGSLETFFCGTCGSTVFAKASKHPSMVGVSVGVIADPAYPAPVRSVWETSMHPWLSLAGDMQHFPHGRPA